LKNMTFRRVKKVNSSGPDSGGNTQENDIYFPSSKSDSCRTSMDLQTKPSDVYNYKTLAYSGGTLPRNFKKVSGIQLCVVELEKSDEETFGFEIQTYGLHHQDQNTVEMCTFVCKVHEDSPAQRSGLKVSDTISSVNEAAVEGFRHKEIVQLIKACGNSLRLETVYSDTIRKAELEARLQYLKQTLHEKWDEYRSLMVQEQRLVHGIVMSDAAIYESLELAGIYGSVGTPSPITAPRGTRGTDSTSSSASLLSTATDDDPLYQTCMYQPDGSVDSDRANQNAKQKPLRSIQRRLRPASELFTTAKTHLTRSASTRSYTRPQSATITPAEKQGGFSSLQRKNKPKSFRRRLLKFIPGLNLPLEEEESKL
uniref:PDZ domain-containing protein n=1 Tax=Periophthalmus magnuspinnatus TaxID=409849 RepID=A0A3B4BK44_9GOBI